MNAAKGSDTMVKKVCEGWFTKKGGKDNKRRARKRFFCLFSDGLIRYYAAVSPDGKPTGEKVRKLQRECMAATLLTPPAHEGLHCRRSLYIRTRPISNKLLPRKHNWSEWRYMPWQPICRIRRDLIIAPPLIIAWYRRSCQPQTLSDRLYLDDSMTVCHF